MSDDTVLPPFFNLNFTYMKNAKFINPCDINMFHFGHEDVLNNNDEKETRRHKLERAMIISNCDHVPIIFTCAFPMVRLSKQNRMWLIMRMM